LKHCDQQKQLLYFAPLLMKICFLFVNIKGVKDGFKFKTFG